MEKKGEDTTIYKLYLNLLHVFNLKEWQYHFLSSLGEAILCCMCVCVCVCLKMHDYLPTYNAQNIYLDKVKLVP